MKVLSGSRCRKCDHLSVPPGSYCPSGCGDDMVKESTSSEGVLYASSVVHITHPTRGVDYALGYVDLDAGPRVLGILDVPMPLGSRVSVRTSDDESENGQHPTFRVRLTHSGVPQEDGSGHRG